MPNTYETYILKQIARIESELREIAKQKEQQDKGVDFWYTDSEYNALFHRKTGQRDVLYMILTGHDNTYNLNH